MAKHVPQRYIRTDDGSPRSQENRVASTIGGRRIPGSGASQYKKGDVEASQFLVECKTTNAASLRITRLWLNKIAREANGVQKWPALAIEIKGGDADPIGEKDWICIPLRVFNKLLERENRDES